MMVDKERYLAIPFWKKKKLRLPNNMRVVHKEEFEDSDLKAYVDTTYFRLIHRLKNIETVELKENYEIKTVDISSEVDDIIFIINNSYEDIKVNKNQVEGWTKEQVYDENLWIFIIDTEINKPVALGIAEFDNDLKEGCLEWIQAIPQYRSQGLGQVLINELLHRFKGKADFVTVSGKCDNETKPEKLYRKCGFDGNDIWHVMMRKEVTEK